MKTTIQSLIAFSLLIVLITPNANATYYTTLKDGAWDNTDRVWSIDGVSACMCTPGSIISGDTVVITKLITQPYNISINNHGILGVASQGRLAGSFNIYVDLGKLNIYGHMSFFKLSISNNSEVMLNNATLTLTNRLDIYGTMRIDHGYLYMTGGNLTIQPFGKLMTFNGAKVDVNGGNIENYGQTNICADCCMTTLGNWKNLISKEGFIGSVTGSGTAQTTLGNMNNYGNWSEDITWCSVGFDTGMPSPENCDIANATCDAIILPVELKTFEVSLNHQNDAEIVWETASELNSDYFEVEKSKNILDWEVVENQQAAGYSTKELYYQAIDRDVAQHITYYRLKQVDLDGKIRYSQIKAISNNSVERITVYPNPANINNDVTITNIDERDIITITNSAGRVLIENSDPGNNGSRVIDIASLTPGIYYISNQENEINSRMKLVVTR